MSSLERADGPRVSDVAENLNRIRVPLSGIERSERQGPYRYYGAQGVIDHIDDYLFDGEYVLVAEDGENLRSRKQPIAFLVSGRFWVNNHAHILKVNGEVANRRYVVNAINQASLAGLVTGAAQPKLTKANLERLHLPPLSRAEQDRVAAVLAAFDELIEINERRIELLEGLARSLYREWFVRFRFPGYNSANGLPSGWQRKPASEVFTINPRIRSSQSSFPKVTMGDVDERVAIVFPSEVVDRASGSRYQHDDVLFARITPCLENGKTALVKFLEPDAMGVGSTEFIVLRGNAVGPTFTYCAARSVSMREHAIKSMSGASGRQRVASSAFDSLELTEPSQSVADEFERQAGPLLDEGFALACQNRAIASTRDLLLPRLVTGRLDISDVDLGVLPPDADAE